MQLSVLDQSPVSVGSTAADALRNSIDLAQLAEDLGYHRYWLAEHHATNALAGSSPEILIGQIAAATSRIRVGSGGVMLSHYSALKVAENFRVLHALFPDRIDLGVGRAPGGDQLTAVALRPGHQLPPEQEFPQQLVELLGFLAPDGGGFEADHPFARITVSPAMPGGPEVWLLGSTNFSAAYAAHLGLPFCFAHFINPADAEAIAAGYRDNYQATDTNPEPHLSVAVSVICGEDDDEAERLASSVRLWRTRLMTTGRPGAVPTVEEALAHDYTPREREMTLRRQGRMIVGGPKVVRTELEELAEEFGADELIIVTITHDHEARRRSYELIMEACATNAL